MFVNIRRNQENASVYPLRLLSDCHRRIEHFLSVLITVTRQAQGAELSPEQRQALDVALRYFREAAPKHTLDEEESLFPKMRAIQDARAEMVLSKLNALEEDHVVADGVHKRVEALGEKWLVEGRLPVESVYRLAETLENLSVIYRDHISIEDVEIFPLAGELLNQSQIEELGREMAARRGIRYNVAILPTDGV